MPQMMPMFWTSMLLFTILMLILIISMLYFTYFPFYKTTNNKIIDTDIIQWSWKW